MRIISTVRAVTLRRVQCILQCTLLSAHQEPEKKQFIYTVGRRAAAQLQNMIFILQRILLIKLILQFDDKLDLNCREMCNEAVDN